MDPNRLDQRADLRLGTTQHDRLAAVAQSSGEQRKIEHQRDVGEAELGQIDDHVGLGAECAGERTPPDSLGAAVLIAGTAEDRRCFGEVDDQGNLLKVEDPMQGSERGMHSIASGPGPPRS
jgi:hypothetical protein